MPRLSRLALVVLAVPLLAPFDVRAGEVVGKVEMPSTCSSIASPAVVTLEPINARQAITASASSKAAQVALVHQQGLQFEPRVQAVVLGQTIRFTNEDNETHNVHILTPGVPFNQTMSPGRPVDFKAEKAGVLRLVCDIHSHMRGYVVVSPTPWASVVRNGRFRLDDVTPGRYKLVAWHEMGEALSKEITVGADRLDVGTLSLTTYESTNPTTGTVSVVRTWPEVIDRISLKLSESRAFAKRSNGAAKARKLAEDAYWDDFESSDMETAVRSHLGFQRAGEIEGHFRDFRFAVRDLAQAKATPEQVVARSRELLLALYTAADELNRAGITDRTKLPNIVVTSAPAGTPSVDDLTGKKRTLAEAFGRIQTLADTPDPAEAASAMTSAYFDAFEPLERILNSHRPQDVRPLEVRFNALRGEIGSGLKGETLATALENLTRDVNLSLDKATTTTGAFLPAFVASLVTIIREGVEVILILTMLVTLVLKTGRTSALPAIRWGVGLAIVASIMTAFGLGLLVSSAQGRAREMIEGWVLLVAAGVLFYVSYWLISQTESKRWTDFLKRQVNEGAAAGALGTLGLTAFLAVYREGAETALMFQAMIVGQGGARLGLAGLAAGVVVGCVILAVIYRLLKSTSTRLPLSKFFKITGAVLFAMAVIFAGNGVFELQQAGVIRLTNISWMQGFSIPWLGLYPNIQALSVQALILGGAAFSLLWPMFDRPEAGTSASVVAQDAKRAEPVQLGT